MTQEEKSVFDLLESLKLKPGETLRTSYFKKGGKEPLYISTVKIDGTFTLYQVNGSKLTKIQSASDPHALEDLILAELK